MLTVEIPSYFSLNVWPKYLALRQKKKGKIYSARTVCGKVDLADECRIYVTIVAKAILAGRHALNCDCDVRLWI